MVRHGGPACKFVARLGWGRMARAMPTYTLNDGTVLPAIGFGTYPLKGEAGAAAISSAIEAGYRLLDSAVNYGNEGAVGAAVRPPRPRAHPLAGSQGRAVRGRLAGAL
jgi:hypothetical protein